MRGIRRRARHDRHAPGHHLDGRIDHVQPFIVRERGRLASSSAGDKKIYAGLNLPRRQIAQRSVIDGAILMKRSDQCSTTATKLHANKITRMGQCGNGWWNYTSRQTSLKS